MNATAKVLFLFASLVVCLFQPACGLKVVKGKQHIDAKSVVRRQIITTLGLSVVGIQALKMIPPEMLRDGVESDQQQIVRSIDSSDVGSKFYNRGDELRKGNLRNWDWYRYKLKLQE